MKYNSEFIIMKCFNTDNLKLYDWLNLNNGVERNKKMYKTKKGLDVCRKRNMSQ